MELFGRFREDSQFNWNVGLAYSEARAHRMCQIAANEYDLELKKIWAYADPAMKNTAFPEPGLDTSLNEQETQFAERNFHVALVAVVKDKGSDSKKLVLDPVLFDAPVTEAEWRRRICPNDQVCNFDVTSRHVVEPFSEKPSSPQMEEILAELVDERLAASSNFSNPETAAAYENFQLGQWIDQEAQRNPEAVVELKQLLDPANLQAAFFRGWWRTYLTGEQILEGLELQGSYFDIPAAELREAFAGVESKDFHLIIKTHYWQRVHSFLGQLYQAYWHINDFIKNPDLAREWATMSMAKGLENSLLSDWLNPFGHALWAHFDLATIGSSN